jgi:TRAP-type C4-dicarboxylate transport system permease small subunit
MEKIWRAIERVSYITGYVAGWVLLGIIGLTMAEVVTRYVLRQPFILCDEFGGYSLFAITFLGLAYCGKEKGHIRITFLVERISPRVAGRIRIVTLSLALLYVAIGSVVSWEFIADSFQREIKSNSWLMVPLKWPQMFLPVGFTLYTLVLIMQILVTIRNIQKRVEVKETGGKEF